MSNIDDKQTKKSDRLVMMMFLYGNAFRYASLNQKIKVSNQLVLLLITDVN